MMFVERASSRSCAASKTRALLMCMVVMFLGFLQRGCPRVDKTAGMVDHAASRKRRLQEPAVAIPPITEKRPLIYTFYQPLVRVSPNSRREQHIRQADQALLEEWKLSWHDAGYEPRVLSLEHAKQHPLYNQYIKLLGTLTLLGEGGRNREYNEYCFLRFLAMAVAGGGLMADYDLIPIINLPLATEFVAYRYTTQFTVFSEALNGSGGIPCLAAGSASEWTRIAETMMELTKHEDNSTTGPLQWSDMVALMELYKKTPSTYGLHNHVVGAKDYVRGQEMHHHWTCPPSTQSQQDIWAMHFSHYDVMAAGHRVVSRASLIHEYRQWLKAQCAS